MRHLDTDRPARGSGRWRARTPPRPASRAAPTLSEASDRAQLDLREERASLIAAGNAALRGHRRPRASPPAWAARSPTTCCSSRRASTCSRGSAAATALPHERPAGAQRARVEHRGGRRVQRRHPGLHLEPGIVDLRLRHRRAARPSFFLIYWRRATVGADWAVAGMVVSLGGPRRAGSPPASARPTPSTAATSPTPRSTAQRAADPRASTRPSRRRRWRRAAGRRSSSSPRPTASRVGGGQYIFGPAALGEAFSSEPTDIISWVPRFSGAAASGDLGFSVGEATFDFGAAGTFYSKYLTVWQKQDTGAWRYVADLGNNRPAPAP